MSKKEVKTDNIVRKLLELAGIEYGEQGSAVLEINEALKSASKAGTGNVGFPEFVALVKDFIIVIEDKAMEGDHVAYTKDGALDMSTSAVKGKAVNGAVWYGRHLVENTSYNKCFALGCSGTEQNHLSITPVFVSADNHAGGGGSTSRFFRK